MTRAVPILLLNLVLLAAASVGTEVASKEPALIWAARNNLMEMAQLMVNQGIDVNQRDLMDNTPLHFAVRFPAMVAFLLDQGAEVNARNFLGETPLHLAIRFRETVRVLLERGADRSARNALGRTPLDYSIAEGSGRYNQSVMRLLLESPD